MGKSTTVIFGLLISLTIVAFGYYFLLGDKKSFSSIDSGLFVQKCSELTGQDFTLENLTKLNGKFISDNELKDVSQEDLNIYTASVNYQQFEIARNSVSKDWRCVVEIDVGTNKIKSTPRYSD
jgi:hypothetical protein